MFVFYFKISQYLMKELSEGDGLVNHSLQLEWLSSQSGSGAGVHSLYPYGFLGRTVSRFLQLVHTGRMQSNSSETP